MQIDPNNNFVYSSLASYLLKNGETEVALEQYRLALLLYTQATSAPSQSEVALRWG